MYCTVELKIPRKTPSLIVPAGAIVFDADGLSERVHHGAPGRAQHGGDGGRDEGARNQRAGVAARPGHRLARLVRGPNDFPGPLDRLVPCAAGDRR